MCTIHRYKNVADGGDAGILQTAGRDLEIVDHPSAKKHFQGVGVIEACGTGD
jgi:hypothetical protein